MLGPWILISPWALQFATAEHAWNAYVVGAGITILAAAALIAFQPWEEWVNLALGAWLLASPWLLGFSTATIAMWNAVIIGALVVVFAGWALAQMQGPNNSLDEVPESCLPGGRMGRAPRRQALDVEAMRRS